MELFQTNEHYIFQKGESSLWCSRITGDLVAKRGSDLAHAWNPVCLGIVNGIIGKIEIHPDLDKKFLFIRQQSLVGELPGAHKVFRINKIGILNLNSSEAGDLNLEPCKKHHFGINKNEHVASSPENKRKPLQKTWNAIKSASAQATSQVKPRKKELRDRARFEKRITDELYKMFNDTDSFYYTPTGDLTNSLQRQYVNAHSSKSDLALWEKVDDRFFWNKHMLQDLINSKDILANEWIVPIIQGYVEIDECRLEDNELGPLSLSREQLNQETITRFYKMIIISRRSRYRAGTRYKRRGVDESGKCANYVETEQIIEYLHHCLSFIQVRGSVPVFWSQPGYKYRPPPRLDKDEETTQLAFEKHFIDELAIYGQQTIINLVEQSGREKVISDAYMNHILNYNSPNLIYISFDFHEYCRGMRFENVSVLMSNVVDIVKGMWYCWTDKQGLICKQQGVFRVNCIDCLDRTNVVQTSLAKAVLETQFTKLGLLPPEGILPASCRNTFQVMWANNGDIISRQYAGTAALKGDFTRTGERRLAGMMKDGYNSANRYYMNRFKDAYRQATIDLMLGNPMSEDMLVLSPDRENGPEEDASWLACQAEHVKQLIDDCKKILVPNPDFVIGGWALVDADPVTGDPAQQDMDTVLILTNDSYYVAEYDDETDRIIRYQRVMLEDLHTLEMGPEPSIFKSRFMCIRFNYAIGGQPGYFHMFRSPNTRFFNNMAVPIKSEEEAIESLKSIIETFSATIQTEGLQVSVYHGKLERRKSKMPYVHNRMSNTLSGINLELPTFSSMPRNVSESQLLALKNVGSKAISNVTSHIAKLNPLNLKLRNKANRVRHEKQFASQAETSSSITEISVTSPALDNNQSVGLTVKPSFAMESSSSSEEEEGSHLAESKESAARDLVLSSCGIIAASPGQTAGLCFVEDHFNNECDQCNRDEKDNLSLEAVKKATDEQQDKMVNVAGNDMPNQSGCQHQPMILLGELDRSTDTSPRPVTPEITISSEDSVNGLSHKAAASSPVGSPGLSLESSPTAQQLGRKLSHSSEELGNSTNEVLMGENKKPSPISRELRRGSEQLAEPTTAGMKMSHSEGAIGHQQQVSQSHHHPVSGLAKDIVPGFSKFARGMQNIGANLGGLVRSPVSTQVPALGNSHQQQLNQADDAFQRKLNERKQKCCTRIYEL